MRANEELHDTRRISNSGPPHDSPPKFEIGLPSGGLYAVSTGNTGWSGVTRPLSTPVEPVTTLNVDPGKKISWNERARNGWSGFASRNVFASCAALLSWVASRFGSYDGKDHSARIEPSRGSSTTTDPFC